MIDRGLAFEYAFLIAAGVLILLILINLRLLLHRSKQQLPPAEKTAGNIADEPLGDASVLNNTVKSDNSAVLNQNIPRRVLEFLSKIKQLFIKILNFLNRIALSTKGFIQRILHPLAPAVRFTLAHKYLLLNLILLPLLGYLIFDLLQSPGVRYQYPANNEVLSDYSRAVEVEFDRPIFLDTFKPYIHPEIAGDWRSEEHTSELQ